MLPYHKEIHHFRMNSRIFARLFLQAQMVLYYNNLYLWPAHAWQDSVWYLLCRSGKG